MGLRTLVRILASKKSSSKTSSLASRYLRLTQYDLLALTEREAELIAKDVRSLAASVLSQDEVKGD